MFHAFCCPLFSLSTDPPRHPSSSFSLPTYCQTNPLCSSPIIPLFLFSPLALYSHWIVNILAITRLGLTPYLSRISYVSTYSTYAEFKFTAADVDLRHLRFFSWLSLESIYVANFVSVDVFDTLLMRL